MKSLKEFALFIGTGVFGMLGAAWAASTAFVKKTPVAINVAESFRVRVAQAKAERDAAATPPTQD
jgi:hypothetical protein